MRVMQRGDTKLNIVEHIMVRNFWEYYVTDDKENDDIILCFVCGAENELGDVSMSEIKPFIMIQTKDLSEVMPAPGWNWVD